MKIKICVSLKSSILEGLIERAEQALKLGADLVEFRLDYLETLSENNLEKLLSNYGERAVFTLRPKWEGGEYEGSEEERTRILTQIAEHNPAYIDIELKTRNLEEILRKIINHCRVILSWHSFNETPSHEELRNLVSKAINLGGLVKIVTFARTFSDNLKVLKLYEEFPSERLIAFTMGEAGTVSRILSPLLGAPIAYACLPGESVAPGQLTILELREALRIVGHRLFD